MPDTACTIIEYTRNSSMVECMRDLLCLMSTFYWSRTIESVDTPVTFPSSVNFSNLINKLTLQLSELTNIKCIEDMYRNDDFLLNFYAEQKYSGEISIHLTFEKTFIISFMEISELLGEVLFSRSFDHSLLLRLKKNILFTIEILLRYSSYNVVNIREIQSLYWILEAYMKEQSILNTNQLLRMIITYTANIYKYIGNIFTLSYIYNLEIIQLQYNIPWIRDHTHKHHHRGLSEALTQLIHQTSNGIRLNHNIEFEIVLSHLDLTFESRRSSYISSAIVNVRSLQNSRIRLYQMLKSIVYCANISHSYTSRSEGKMYLLKYQVLEVVYSLRGLLPVNIASILVNILDDRNYRNDRNHRSEESLFQSILELQLDTHCVVSVIAQLLHSCLRPLLTLLTTTQQHTNVENGCMWCYLSILRLHLLCPTSGVDPAMEDTIKHELMLEHVDNSLHYLTTYTWNSHQSGQQVIDSSMSILLANTTQLVEDVNILASKVISRPLHTPCFIELFHELRGMCENILNIDVISLISHVLTNNISDMEYQSIQGLQSTLLSIITRIEHTYPQYIDITSPIVSSLYTLSNGLALISSTRVSSFEQESSVDSAMQQLLNTSILTLPLDNWSEFKQHVLHTVNTLPEAVHIIQARHRHMCCDVSDVCLDTLLTLSRIDVLVGTQIISPYLIKQAFNTALQMFSTSVSTLKSNQLVVDAEKNAAYKYRTKQDEYNENTEQREELELRENFPDYTKDLGVAVNAEGQVYQTDEVSLEDSNVAPNLQSSFRVDDLSKAQLVGLHSRMVFFYTASYLESIGACYVKAGQMVTTDLVCIYIFN